MAAAMAEIVVIVVQMAALAAEIIMAEPVGLELLERLLLVLVGQVTVIKVAVVWITAVAHLEVAVVGALGVLA
jgi:hypothetical protein